MSEQKLGTWPAIGDDRDAVHVPIVPVRCKQDFKIAERVKIKHDGSEYVAEYCAHDDHDGMIDPFLGRDPVKGEVVFMCMRPGSIISLSHVWYHPKVRHLDQTKAAKMALESFASEIGTDLETLLRRVERYVDSGDYWVEGGRFEGQRMPNDFWDNYEIVTGTKVEKEDQGHFFSCSCQ